MSPLCVTLVSASLLLGAATAQTAGCCQTKVVGGSDSLAGTYNLYTGQATFLDICMDQCAYTRDGGSELYCFKTEGATHQTECTDTTGSVTMAATSAAAGGAGCPYSKDNVSWGEYQMTIPVAGSTAPIAVVLTFDAATTIGSCHSNCQDISCSGSTCTLTYQSSSTPLQMFNIRKTNAAGDSDRSNLLSVTLNGVEQC